jgi:hypothetical protein
MPEVRQVIARTGAPDTLVLATRYGGHYITHDGGATWFNVCHEALGSDDSETYGGLFSRDGTFIASTGFRGIASSVDGCVWTDWSPPQQSFITDVAIIGDSDILALDRDVPHRVWSSTVDGKSFLPYGTALPEDVDVSTIGASTDGWHVYIGASGPSGFELIHSADAAESWERLPLPAEGQTEVDVIGILRDSPESVVIRLQGVTRTVLVMSRDAGKTWATLFETDRALPAATLNADGTLFFGGPDLGVFAGSVLDATMTPAFEHVSDMPTLGLTYADGRLFSVASQLTSGYSVALSQDGGTTFAPFFDVCNAPVSASCAAESTVAMACSKGIETSAWQPLGNACLTGTGEPDAPLPPPTDDGSGTVDTPAAHNACGIVRTATPAGSGAPLVVSVLVLAAAGLRRRAPGDAAGSR